METANAKMIEKNTFIAPKVSLPTACVRLFDCSRDCVADRRFEFQKRRQPFVRRAPVNAATLCKEGYPRHPKGALLAKQLRKVNSMKGNPMRRITIVLACAMIAPLAFGQATI